MAREAGEAGIGDVAAARPVGDGVELDLEERREVLARVAKDSGLGDIGACPQDVLDVGRRERLAAGGNDEVARAVEEAQPPVLPFADVAGAQPPVGAAHFARRLGLADVFLEHIVAAELNLSPHLARLGEPQLPARRQRADVAGAWKRALLAADDRADLLGLPVRLAQVRAPDLPQRGGLLRQRGAGANHEPQLVEAELVQHRPEDQRAANRIENGIPGPRRAVPARACVATRDHHRRLVSAPLERARFHHRHQNAGGELLQIARHGEKHRRCDFKKCGGELLDILAEMRHQAAD